MCGHVGRSLCWRLLGPRGPGAEGRPQPAEGELIVRWERVEREPAKGGDVVGRGHLAAGCGRLPDEIENWGRIGPVAVRVHEGADEVARLDDEAGFLEQLPAQPVQRILALLEESAGSVPEPRVGLLGATGQEDATVVVAEERSDGRRRVRPVHEAAGPAFDAASEVSERRRAARAVPPVAQDAHGGTVLTVPRHVPANVTELARVGLFATLPGETLGKLADRMQRDEVESGTVLLLEGQPGDRFYVLLSGLAGVSQSSLGERGILRAGEFFGEVALAMGVPRTATVTALTSCVVASCDTATFDELVRPLFAEDG